MIQVRKSMKRKKKELLGNGGYVSPDSMKHTCGESKYKALLKDP